MLTDPQRNTLLSHSHSARDAVISAIRKAIISGVLAPGEHLVEQALAEQHGVSRGPVREALAVLQKLGFVDYIRNRGMFVAQIDITQGREIYLIRGQLEGLACSLAARNGSTEEIEELTAINERMAGLTEELDAFIRVNFEFHLLIHKMARSPLLAQMIQELLERARKFREAGFFVEHAPENSVEDHAMMLYAIRARDEELARLLGARAVHKRWPGLLEELQPKKPLAGGMDSPLDGSQAGPHSNGHDLRASE